jgi:tetratricopeptide (TPR) repeat protein
VSINTTRKSCATLLTGFLTIVLVARAQTDGTSLSALLDRYAADPRNALLCEQIGVAYTRLKDFDKAATYFRKAVDLNPQRVSAEKNLATVLWFAGREHESASIFAALAKRIPNDPIPQLYLGLSAYEAKNIEGAAEHFEHAGTFASDDPEVLLVVIDSYLSTGRFQLASGILENRIRSGQESSQTYRWLGDAYDGQTLPEKAYVAYSKAIEMEPRVAENYLALAAFSIKHANLSFARDVLNRGLHEIAGSSKLTLELGLAWALQGDFDNAKKAFLDASMADSKWSMPLLALGVTELQTGSAERAAECFRKAKLIDPKDYRCYYLYGLALTRTSRSNNATTRAQAITELHRAIELDPKQAKPRVTLAQAEISCGNLKEAETELRTAVRIDPNEPTALYRLGLLYQKEGKTEEAERLLREFRKLKNKFHEEENEYVLILKEVK